MRKTLRIAVTVLVLLCCTALLCACGSSGGSGQTATTPTAAPTATPTTPAAASDDLEQGFSYEGTALTVTLTENPTTGYVWSYTMDGQNFAAAGDEYLAYPTSAGTVGSGGVHVFHFTAVSPGTTQMTFRLARPGDGGQVDKTYETYGTVDDAGNVTDAGYMVHVS